MLSTWRLPSGRRIVCGPLGQDGRGDRPCRHAAVAVVWSYAYRQACQGAVLLLALAHLALAISLAYFDLSALVFLRQRAFAVSLWCLSFMVAACRDAGVINLDQSERSVLARRRWSG